MILDDYIVFYLREKSNRKTFPQIYNPLQFILLIIVNVFFESIKNERLILREIWRGEKNLSLRVRFDFCRI